jgi:hypothetical protein
VFIRTSTATCFGPHWPSSSGTHIVIYKEVIIPTTDPLSIVQIRWKNNNFFIYYIDRICGLVVRVLGYRSGGPGSIPGTSKKKVVGLERGPLSLVGTTEELLDRKVAAPV